MSNFLPEHLDRLEMQTPVTPAVNQVELHPAFQPWKDIDAARVHGIRVQAWSPLGMGRNGLLDAPEVVDVAAAHGVSPAQAIIRWHLQNGVILFPKSAHPERIRENLDVFGFELSDDELGRLDALDTGKRGGPEPHEVTLESFGKEIPEA